MTKVNGAAQIDCGAELTALLGPDRVDVAPGTIAEHSVDGLPPRAVALPKSVAELAEVCAWALRTGAALSPWGGGTKQGVGKPLSRLDVIVRTDPLSRVLEIDAGNLTAQVEGGLSLVSLAAELSRQGLFFPLDPTDGEEATVGGVIATNASGPRRLLHRTARDQVLGLHVMLPNGESLHTGGKSVKDVAGYNLTKPMIGSWGTLGVVAGAILRLLPKPEASETVLARFAEPRTAAQMALAIRGSELLPAAMELCSDDVLRTPSTVSGQGSIGHGALLLIGLEGSGEDVDRMARQVALIAERTGAEEVSTLGAVEAAPLWRARSSAQKTLVSGRPDAVQLKASVPMAGLGNLIAAAAEIARAQGATFSYAAHAGNGVARLFLLPSSDNGDSLPLLVGSVRDVAAAMGGFVVVERAPLSLKRGMGALPARDDFALMRTLREALNPLDTLNPGKMV